MSLILIDSKLMTLSEANKRKGFENNESYLKEFSKKHQILDGLSSYSASNGISHEHSHVEKLAKGAWKSVMRKPDGRIRTQVTFSSQYGSKGERKEDMRISFGDTVAVLEPTEKVAKRSRTM